ncbi:MAG: NAD-dependent epimerase/dehydratase family protein [Ktedonobacterales bacterium]
MSIVVTGGAGFIGRHLVTRLCESRAAFGVTDEPIVVLDNLRRGAREALASLVTQGQVRFVEGDIRDAATLAEVMRGATHVFHLAAQSNVMGAEDDPDYAFTTNVEGTYRVVQAAAHACARRVVFTSSREVYGQPVRLPVAEEAQLAPKNGYGASKAAGEMLCRTAASRGGLEMVTLRLANVYGPGDTGRVIPLWLECAERGEELLIYGGDQVLDFIWVGDAVDALLRAALAPRKLFAAAGILPDEHVEPGFFVALNVGTGRGTAIRTLAERVCEVTGHDVGIRVLPPRTAEVVRFVADIWLMRRTLGLRPELPLACLPQMVHGPITPRASPRPQQTKLATASQTDKARPGGSFTAAGSRPPIIQMLRKTLP